MTGDSMVPQVGQVGSLSPSSIPPKLASTHVPGTTRKWTPGWSPAVVAHPGRGHRGVAVRTDRDHPLLGRLLAGAGAGGGHLGRQRRETATGGHVGAEVLVTG